MRFLRCSYIRIRLLSDASLMYSPSGWCAADTRSCEHLLGAFSPPIGSAKIRSPVGSHQDFMPVGPIAENALGLSFHLRSSVAPVLVKIWQIDSCCPFRRI